MMVSFALAVISGAISRHPKFFDQSIVLDEEDMKDRLTMLKSAISTFKEMIEDNEKSLDAKSSWASAAYICVTISIGCSLGLLATLFSAIFRLPPIH